MAYSTPTDRSTGDIITAAAWNADLVANMKQTAPELVTAKGDLVAGTASHALTRLPIGASGHIIKSHPAATTGLLWTDALRYSEVFMGAPDPKATSSQTYVDLDLLAAAINTAFFSGSVNAYLEATFRTDIAATPAYVQLALGGTAVSGSELSTNSETATRLKTAAFTLPVADALLTVQGHGSGGNSCFVSWARMIVEMTGF